MPPQRSCLSLLTLQLLHSCALFAAYPFYHYTFNAAVNALRRSAPEQSKPILDNILKIFESKRPKRF